MSLTNNNNNNNKEGTSMSLLKKFTELPGIQGLIWDLEEKGIYIDDQMIVDKRSEVGKVNSLLILDCAANVDRILTENKVDVMLLLCYGEQAIMMVNIQYYVDNLGNYMFVDARDTKDKGSRYWFTNDGWPPVYASQLHEWFIAMASVETEEEAENVTNEYDCLDEVIPMCASFRYNPVQWIAFLFEEMEGLLETLEKGTYSTAAERKVWVAEAAARHAREAAAREAAARVRDQGKNNEYK